MLENTYKNKLIKKWHEKLQERKAMQKCTKNSARGRIATRDYSPLHTFTGIIFTNRCYPTAGSKTMYEL